LFPGKPVTLGVVIISILLISYTGLSSMGFHVAGPDPWRTSILQTANAEFIDLDSVVELVLPAFLWDILKPFLAGRTLALKNNYTIDPGRN
jgi:hypothetical protein